MRAARELSEGSIYEAVLFRVSLCYLTLQLWQVDILSYVRLILLSYVRMTFCPWLTHKYYLPQALLTIRRGRSIYYWALFTTSIIHHGTA